MAEQIPDTVIAILTFQGFTESDHHRSGTEDLYFGIIRKFASEDVTTYQPRTWTASVGVLADQLIRQGIRRVALVSYSHGQAAATAFARLAYARGITVDLWLACDPVYRPTWLPRWNILQPLAFRAMLPTGKISVPASIRRVAWVRQQTDLPRGHDLIAADPSRTHIDAPLTLSRTHTAIDHATEWFDMVKAELATWCHPPKAIPVPA